MKPGYHEDYAGELDPLDQTPIDFDWSLLEAAMGELQPDLEGEHFAELAEALRRLLAWLVNVRAANPPEKAANLIGRRTLALLWVVDPRLITDSPSLSQLAERLGVSKAVLSHSAAQVTREFGVRNRAQVHGWNRRVGGKGK
ncbi:MAG: hypothetical protein ACKOET_10975, partial [Verrucomicrobiota bacterium]